MRRWAVVLSAVTISLGAATTVAGTAIADPPDNNPYTLSNGHANVMGGVVFARGDAHSARPGGGSSPLLSWHGQRVQTSPTQVQPIFWGGSWVPGTEVPSGIDKFYDGVGGTAYAGTNSEYTTDGSTNGTHVNTSVSRVNTDAFDPSAAPKQAPQTSTILSEVIEVIGADNLISGAYYPVYIDQPRGHAGYCAWHSSGTATTSTGATVQIQFGFFFNLTGDSGCDVGATNNHSVDLSALGNVSGHELSEMLTDPTLNAWYDSSGNENADKCAWTFSGNPVKLGTDNWTIQGNWSNAAYNSNSGYTYNGSKVRGCVDGT